MIEVNKEVRRRIFEEFGPLAEAWSGLRLLPTSIYGIRRYLNRCSVLLTFLECVARSSLLAHTDRPTTHVISAILNIAQQVRKSGD